MHSRYGVILLLGTSAFISLIPASGVRAAASDLPFQPEETRPGIVRFWNSAFTSSTSMTAIPRSALGGGTLASGDLEGDGTEEIVVGAGPTAEPYINIFNADHTKRRAFIAFEKTFRGGVRVTLADVDGDGKDEIIAAPGADHAPIVRIFRESGELVTETAVYQEQVRGGVHVAAIDLQQDGKDEIVTSPGPGGGPHIRIWDGTLHNVGMDFFAFDASMQDGVSIASMKTTHGPMLLAAPESWSDPIIRRFSFTPTPMLASEFSAFDLGQKNGVSIASVDIDQDGTDEIAVARNGGAAPEVRLFDLYGTRIGSWLLHDPTYRGGLSLFAYDHGSHLMSMPLAPVVRGSASLETLIDVNLTTQRLTAYEHGRIARSFLISSGLKKYPTPVASTEVLKKIPIMDYRWSYGKDHPDNYNIKNVKFNLNILPHIYIHTAYWHNNFGRRMSHGCINAHISDAEWIYNWASTGTRVEIHN